jgi:hypothetical protein
MKYENPALRMKQKYDNPNNENKKIEKFRRLKLIKILKITENHPPPKNSFLPPAPPPTPQEFHFNEMISIVGTNMNSTELLERATEYKKGVLYYEESENIIIFDIKAYYNRLVFEGKTDVNNNYIPIYYIFEFLHNLGFTQIFVYDYSCNTIIKNMKNSHKSIFDEAEFVGSLSHSGGSGNGSSGNGSGGDNSGSNSDTGLRSTARAER